MRVPRPGTTFLVSLFLGAAVVLAWAGLTRSSRTGAYQLVEGIWVSEQVMPNDVAALKQKGFHSIIDLRPDGEQQGQPGSAEIKAAASANDLSFAYVPVPHGDIPNSQVDSLGLSLAAVEKPVMLYCRSGRRAARTWALSEASRPGGLDANAIRLALDSAGQPSSDLDSAIAERIAKRRLSQ
jgi:uncharacterized protein (TIGR01244 family)